MSILNQTILQFRQKAAEFLLPNACLLCGVGSSAILCPECVADLPALSAVRCSKCAEPTGTQGICGHCLIHSPHFDGTTALFRYDFPVDRLIHALKYGSQLSIADWFGRQLSHTLVNRNFDLLIPLPLHPSRLAKRGFNQAVEISRRLSHILSVPIDLTSCKRTRHTLSQAALALTERASNVRGAFECSRDLTGKHIFLVDDVLTTGATLNECARVLKLHGAATVDVAVVARTLRS